MGKLWLAALALPAAALLYNLDAIIGQWKFEKLCDVEGGSRFYVKAVKDVGWEVESEDPSAYQVPFNFGHVSFVRFRKQGDLFDARVKTGPTASFGRRT